MLWFSDTPILMSVGGFSMAVGNASGNTLLQSNVDPKLLGQASSLFMLAMRGSLPLSSLLTGLTVEFLGIQHALLANGTLAIIVQFLITFFLKSANSGLKKNLSAPPK